MKQFINEIAVSTSGRGFFNISSQVKSWVREQNISIGLLTVFIKHTSASLVIQENADPDVLHDMAVFFKDLVKDGDTKYRHSLEGPDDMSAHIRTSLTSTHLSIPVNAGVPCLGTWQGIFLFEHRTHAHNRTVVLHLIGE